MTQNEWKSRCIEGITSEGWPEHVAEFITTQLIERGPTDERVVVGYWVKDQQFDFASESESELLFINDRGPCDLSIKLPAVPV